MTSPRAHLIGTAAVVVVSGVVGVLSYVVFHRWSRGGVQTSTAADAPAPVDDASPPRLAVPRESPFPAEDRAKAMELLSALKQNANVAFRESRYDDALRGYQDCIEVTSVLGAGDAEAVQAEMVVRANIAMVCIRMQEYDAARAVATMLLQDAAVALPDDLKVKVLYRRGLASKALNERGAALADFIAAVHFSKDQQNPAAEKEIALLRRAGG
ncbi:hypothetical protein NESM_000809100 [Novymonas esmeraldas]|uniref:Tetratricopeptide repeat protein n=1 Tax=Novymonas esmeraldas TaxID=1808958 RepID=A0AAW0EYA1_9TRYP